MYTQKLASYIHSIIFVCGKYNSCFHYTAKFFLARKQVIDLIIDTTLHNEMPFFLFSCLSMT